MGGSTFTILVIGTHHKKIEDSFRRQNIILSRQGQYPGSLIIPWISFRAIYEINLLSPSHPYEGV